MWYIQRYLQFPGVMSWLPTAAGLALIPFIVAPLDNLVEEVSRQFYHTSRNSDLRREIRTVTGENGSNSEKIRIVDDCVSSTIIT